MHARVNDVEAGMQLPELGREAIPEPAAAPAATNINVRQHDGLDERECHHPAAMRAAAAKFHHPRKW